MKSIKPEEFFKMISINSGGVDPEVVQRVYYGMIRTISRELKGKQNIKLPDWGDFKLKLHKSRRSVDVNTGLLTIIPPKAIVKFSPDYKVKKYFHEFGSNE